MLIQNDLDLSCLALEGEKIGTVEGKKVFILAHYVARGEKAIFNVC